MRQSSEEIVDTMVPMEKWIARKPSTACYDEGGLPGVLAETCTFFGELSCQLFVRTHFRVSQNIA